MRRLTDEEIDLVVSQARKQMEQKLDLLASCGLGVEALFPDKGKARA